LAPVVRSIGTPWSVLRHACEAHRDALDREMQLQHEVMPVSEW
jgi:hypothetical protein